ncbi:kelch repeat and BTB domain-containing protein 13 [Protopterus annectens]|uniref:kelch repeat and BTB domain-containing protein 13 n=1 Tax=Protopterus annectens TaxID=7888 RepID=UPI001CFC0E5B|nr:kelch repeat and BTB domain-containing protein 13 [Protopterus annectens]
MTSMLVQVEEKSFSVEKTLLVENSEYFRALFESGMKESRQDEIKIQGLTNEGFCLMLSILRGERPVLSCDEIIFAVECAAFLQVKSLTKYLINSVNSENCLVMFEAAATYGLLDLFHTAALLIRDIYSKLENDLDCLPEDLISYIESLVPSTLVAVGAHSPKPEFLEDCSRTVCYLDQQQNKWKTLTKLPDEASTSLAGITVLDNKVYIVGGVCGVNKQAVEQSFCYDVSSNTWSKFPSPQQLRYDLALTSKEGYLYAIGGEYERTLLASVEKYEVSSKVWSFGSHLPQPAACTACTQTMGRIFICLWQPLDTTEIYEYETNKDKWLLIATLKRSQSYGHCLVSHRDNLYIIRNGPADDFLRCMIDRFNLTTLQLTTLSGQYVNSKGALFNAVVRGDTVLTVNKMLTLMYSIEENRWKPRKECTGFPRGGTVHTFLLRIPKKVLHSEADLIYFEKHL